MTVLLFLGSSAATLGGIMIASPLMRRSRTERALSERTTSHLEGNNRKLIESLIGAGERLPWSDLVSLYWNSRDLLRAAQEIRLEDPKDPELAAMLELEEDAHARTRRNLWLHIHERLGIGSYIKASQVYSLFLLDSYGEELTVIELMRERLKERKSCLTEAF